MPARVFDADAAARELLESDPEVKRAIVHSFGPEYAEANARNLPSAPGVPSVQSTPNPDTFRINRPLLRELVFREEKHRRTLEAILHPKIRSRWTTEAENTRRDGGWMFVDIPLLFETGAESAFDTVAAVVCSAATQRARIVSERKLPAELADRMIASQQSLSSKAARADHVIWNDSPLARLAEQAQIFAGYLQERYG